MEEREKYQDRVEKGVLNTLYFLNTRTFAKNLNYISCILYTFISLSFIPILQQWKEFPPNETQFLERPLPPSPMPYSAHLQAALPRVEVPGAATHSWLSPDSCPETGSLHHQTEWENCNSCSGCYRRPL
jgi:hypothetical protein